MQSAISASSVDALRKDAELKHAAYSAAFEDHHNAEIDLGAAAAVRSALVKNLEAHRRLLIDLRRAAIDAATGPLERFKPAAAAVLTTSSEVAILNQAAHRFLVYDYSDFLRVVLAAKVRMLESQHTSEEARLQHRISEITHSLAPIAARSGGLEVSLGGAVRGHTELVARIARDFDAARSELQGHDAETRELRDAYEKEQSK